MAREYARRSRLSLARKKYLPPAKVVQRSGGEGYSSIGRGLRKVSEEIRRQTDKRPDQQDLFNTAMQNEFDRNYTQADMASTGINKKLLDHTGKTAASIMASNGIEGNTAAYIKQFKKEYAGVNQRQAVNNLLSSQIESAGFTGFFKEDGTFAINSVEDLYGTAMEDVDGRSKESLDKVMGKQALEVREAEHRLAQLELLINQDKIFSNQHKKNRIVDMNSKQRIIKSFAKEGKITGKEATHLLNMLQNQYNREYAMENIRRQKEAQRIGLANLNQDLARNGRRNVYAKTSLTAEQRETLTEATVTRDSAEAARRINMGDLNTAEQLITKTINSPSASRRQTENVAFLQRAMDEAIGSMLPPVGAKDQFGADLDTGSPSLYDRAMGKAFYTRASKLVPPGTSIGGVEPTSRRQIVQDAIEKNAPTFAALAGQTFNETRTLTDALEKIGVSPESVAQYVFTGDDKLFDSMKKLAKKESGRAIRPGEIGGLNSNDIRQLEMAGLLETVPEPPKEQKKGFINKVWDKGSNYIKGLFGNTDEKEEEKK